MTLLVRSGGLATRDVVTAAATIDDDALLVLRGEARPLSTLAPSERSDALLRDAWAALGRLDELRVAHQQIDPETLAVVSGAVGFVDFGTATVAPTSVQLVTDRAQLLTTTASLVGSEQAIRVALDVLGGDKLGALLPYLQSAALTPSLRNALDRAELDIDDLRTRTAGSVGMDPPELAKLRRVSVRALVQVALLGFAAYTLLDAAAGRRLGRRRRDGARRLVALDRVCIRRRAAAQTDAGAQHAWIGADLDAVRPGRMRCSSRLVT